MPWYRARFRSGTACTMTLIWNNVSLGFHKEKAVGFEYSKTYRSTSNASTSNASNSHTTELGAGPDIADPTSKRNIVVRKVTLVL